MRNLPRMSREGILSREVWNNTIAPILEANFREVAIQPGKGYDFSRSSGGTFLNPKKTSSAIVLPKKPFNISTGGTSEAPTITLWPGVVNGILPSNIYDTFSVDAVSLWYVKAACTSDGTQITAATIHVDASPPDIQTPATDAMPSEVDVLVGLYKASMTYNIFQGNVTLTPSTVSSADGHYSGVWIAS